MRIETAKREDQSLAEGDLDGIAVWWRINEAIRQLEDIEIPEYASMIN